MTGFGHANSRIESLKVPRQGRSTLRPDEVEASGLSPLEPRPCVAKARQEHAKSVTRLGDD